MRKLLLILLLAAACAPLAHAQSSSGDRDKFNFFVGYSHNRVDTGANDAGLAGNFDEREGFNGVNASVTGNVSRYVGLKFDYSYHRGNIDGVVNVICVAAPCPPVPFSTHARVHNFLGGVQLKDNTKDSDKRLRPFGHVLVGAHRSAAEFQAVSCLGIGVCPPGVARDDETGFAAAVGGGLDVRLSDRFSVRAIQLDWNPNRFSDDGVGTGSRTSHNFRVGVGVVFH
ncbi:MAG TPA: outer membrane beta-barrel protein [Pyrinomonadaceae bacterium]|nr:outer membrane beta-barrel protein [Pyrinomonadaceae bacterium]